MNDRWVGLLTTTDIKLAQKPCIKDFCNYPLQNLAKTSTTRGQCFTCRCSFCGFSSFPTRLYLFSRPSFKIKMFKTLTLNKGYGDSLHPLMEQIGITLKYDLLQFQFHAGILPCFLFCFLTLTGL